MLPPIPDKLWKIDESTVGQHFLLEATDRCFYIWEYAARRGYQHSPANQLIANLKIKPTEIARNSRRNYYKQQAIDHAAEALRRLISASFVESRATLVPIPGSKAADDPDYDDRLVQVLRRAFPLGTADIRGMLELTESTIADHENPGRLSRDGLLAITRLNHAADMPLRSVVVLVDDVLTSGKHFKIAQRLILDRVPDAEIRGVFLARCTHDEPEFDAIAE